MDMELPGERAILNQFYNDYRKAIEQADEEMQAELDDPIQVSFTIRRNSDGSAERVLLLDGKPHDSRLITPKITVEVTKSERE